MWGTSVLYDINEKAARVTRRKSTPQWKKRPYFPGSIAEIEAKDWKKKIPNFGNYEPEGYELVEGAEFDFYYGSDTEQGFENWMIRNFNQGLGYGYSLKVSGQFVTTVEVWKKVQKNPAQAEIQFKETEE